MIPHINITELINMSKPIRKARIDAVTPLRSRNESVGLSGLTYPMTAVPGLYRFTILIENRLTETPIDPTGYNSDDTYVTPFNVYLNSTFGAYILLLSPCSTSNFEHTTLPLILFHLFDRIYFTNEWMAQKHSAPDIANRTMPRN